MTEIDEDFYKSINFDITFEQSLKETEKFFDILSSEKLTEEDIENVISLLVMSENGARGFFVNYLTTEREFAEQPSTGVINALKSSPEIVSELLVKNLAMSTATTITHQENGDEDLAKGSEVVQRRTLNLLEKLALPQIKEKLLALTESLKTNQGKYQSFLERWGYDQEQKEAIAKIIPSLI